ncbi:MAG: hypothetical protein EPN85_08280 [Bacteroidetes bacterium]|nr:MAG: hypothetical protein EPN85_08280 [Bacteroidota bacterium]
MADVAVLLDKFSVREIASFLKENHAISSERVIVENVIRKIKVFRIMAEKYRSRRRRFSLRLNLICALINFEL